MFRLEGNGVTYSRPYDHLLHIDGCARIYTNKSDVTAFADLALMDDQKLYSYAWMDRHGGSAGEMRFVDGNGHFELDVPVQNNELDMMKNQVQWWNKDPDSRNHRAVTFGVGACVLPELMTDGSSEFMVRDSITPGNYARITMTLKNADEFRNRKGNGNRTDLPEITFRPSALWNIQKSNEIMVQISNNLKQCVDRNKISIPDPASAFMEGLTR